MVSGKIKIIIKKINEKNFFFHEFLKTDDLWKYCMKEKKLIVKKKKKKDEYSK